MFYAFVEPSVNWRVNEGVFSDTRGQRIVAGLGSDYIGLFRGEVFGGYQRQTSPNPGAKDNDGVVFGGSISYYPTRALTFTLSLDQSFAEALSSCTRGRGGGHGGIPDPDFGENDLGLPDHEL